jgi:hypothetical protein
MPEEKMIPAKPLKELLGWIGKRQMAEGEQIDSFNLGMARRREQNAKDLMQGLHAILTTLEPMGRIGIRLDDTEMAVSKCIRIATEILREATSDVKIREEHTGK